MLHALMRGIRVMTKSGSDASHLISRHRRADATSADQHPTVRTAIEYRLSDGLCEIGIIDGIRAVGPHIHNPVAQFSQVVGQDTLQLESGMVRTDCDVHISLRLRNLLFGCGHHRVGSEAELLLQLLKGRGSAESGHPDVSVRIAFPSHGGSLLD
jgi:hypothetical protein